MKILIDECDLLERVMQTIGDNSSDAFYEGPKLAHAAQSGRLTCWFEDFDGMRHLVLDWSDRPVEEDEDDDA